MPCGRSPAVPSFCRHCLADQVKPRFVGVNTVFLQPRTQGPSQAALRGILYQGSKGLHGRARCPLRATSLAVPLRTSLPSRSPQLSFISQGSLPKLPFPGSSLVQSKPRLARWRGFPWSRTEAVPIHMLSIQGTRKAGFTHGWLASLVAEWDSVRGVWEAGAQAFPTASASHPMVETGPARW